MTSTTAENTIHNELSPREQNVDVTVLLENDSCRVLKLIGDDGEGMMTIYQVMDGIKLIYNDFHMSGYLSELAHNDSGLYIDHCIEGRMELQTGSGTVHHMEKHDMRIDRYPHYSGSCYFPLSHYHGITICILPKAEQALQREFPTFSVPFAELADKFCPKGQPLTIHNDPSLENLFHCLYHLPGTVPKEYFKLKIMELLVYLSSMDVDAYKIDRPYFYTGQVEKIRAIHELMTSDLTKTYTAEELSKRFSISLTAMKHCFKSTYGSPIYTYLKQYRLSHAAKLLITRRDLKVSEIGAMVGYESPSKFTAAFHEVMGQTPLEYRKAH